MDCSSFTPNSAFGTFSDTAMDLDLMDELLCDGCWVKIGDEFSVPQAEPPTSGVLNPSRYASLMGSNCGTSGTNSHQETDQKVEEKNFVDNPPQDNHIIGTLDGTDSQSQVAAGDATSLVQSRNFPLEGGGLDRGWWIGPTANPEPSSSVKERLKCAIEQLKGFTEDGDVLIQIWVPIKKGGKDVLSTMDQPFFIDGESKSLGSYRNVSKAYHFPTDGDPKQLVGLPGRVFLQKLPDWTPDVSFFRSEEYPRKSYAKQYNIRGSLAVPVFERGSWTCLGVVEVVTTAQKVNYRPELENVCKALEAVDLRSSQDCCPPSMKACKEFYQEAVPEISEILESVCKTHRLPLALAWAPCFRKGKGGCRHFDKSYAHCISTLDSACFVADSDLLPFHVACSEQYLFLGQGIVGKAFTTNKQHFANDITAFSKTEYPFSHHAMMFGLHAALAIPLQGTSAGSADFVLEFFLPKDCQDTEKQKQMNYLLPLAVQQACRRLNVVMDRDLDENIYRQEGQTHETVSSVSKKTSPEESPWVSRLMEAQKKGKSICASLEGPKEEPEEEFKVRTQWDNTREEELYNKQQITGPGQFQQSSGSKVSSEYRKDSSLAGDPSLGTRKAGEKRRTKTEKTIGLPVLRQYFAGSLKDAAKSLGVCPTTLKRICRQHGIARWPSRKIKKVGHSLKKLQLVIDSVQGAEGAIQIGSFYTTFPELNSPNPSVCDPFSTPKMTDNVKQSNPQAERGAGTSCGGASASKSPSSSCSHSSGSSTCCSAGAKQHATGQTFSIGDACTVEDPGSVLKRTHSDAELHALNREEPKVLARSQSHKTFADHPNLESLPPFPNSSGRNQDDESSLRVKATFGEDKVRFSLQPRWGFKDLQQELANRFNIQGVCTVGIKYLDDDHEWVLLTCDDDLEECKDIYRLSHKRTIKIILNQASQEHPDSTFGGAVPLYMP